jgi:hypothetical protein
VDGYLVFDEKLAQLFDLETDQEMMRIEPVRRANIKSGVLIVGDEMHFRGTKSKGEAHRQAWWCTPITRVVQSPESGRAH